MTNKILLGVFLFFQLTMMAGIFIINSEELISADSEIRLMKMYENVSKAPSVTEEQESLALIKNQINVFRTMDEKRRDLVRSGVTGLALSFFVEIFFLIYLWRKINVTKGTEPKE
jgi:hypothetical protein